MTDSPEQISYHEGFDDGRADGYRKGLERAAEISEANHGPGYDHLHYNDAGSDIAAAIRAEIEKPNGEN